MTQKKLSGSKLAGGNPAMGRVKDDFYATPPEATKLFLEKHIQDLPLNLNYILEPSAGEGHISEVLKEYFPQSNVISRDIEDRGYSSFDKIENFLESDTTELFDLIMTNPPFKLIKEFIEHGNKKLNNGGQLILFAKLQLLESVSRRELFEKMPPKYVYVHSKRVPVWRDGQKINPKTGKKWATTMAFAWFVWEKDFKGEPVIRWI